MTSMVAPTISVLMPTNRLDSFFELALQSVAADLTADSEVLVVLNGEAIERARAFDWARFDVANLRVLKSFENGLVAALNLGLSEARGEFIARMDADDLTLPGRFKQQAAFLRKRSDFAAVGTQIVEVCQHGNLGARSYLPERLSRHWPPLNTKIAHPSVMFRRDSVLMLGGYRTTFLHAEDQDLWLRLLKVSRLGNLRTVFLAYRKHDNQVSVANAAEQNLGLLQTYLSNARVSIPDDEILEAQNSDDFRKIIWSPNQLGLKDKLFLDFIVRYWVFCDSVCGELARFVSRGVRHPLLAIAFVWANRRTLLKSGRARQFCTECG